MKYRIGQKVKIVDALHGHEFPIGTEVTITEEFPDGHLPYYEAKDRSGTTWCIEYDEVEEIKKEKAA